MGIATEVDQHKQAHEKAVLCKVGFLISKMSSEEAEAAEYAIEQTRAEAHLSQNHRHWTQAFVHDLFVRNGYTVGKTAIRDHLKKECTCANRR